MCTPWTVTKFIRRRLRDWTSCFLACRFPLDDDDDDDESETSKKIVLDMNSDMRGNKDKRMSSRQRNRCRNGKTDRKDKNRNANTTIISTVSMENMVKSESSSSWPHFQEEDYIVFCFKEDGAFEVIKDFNSEALDLFDSAHNRSSRPVNRKLNYGEIAETARKSSSNGKRLNVQGNDAFLRNGERISPLEEGEEEENSYLDIESPSTTESSGSNRSESSSGSFSFPVLQSELIGSPTKMPKSESLCIRKHKVSCARFQCCRF
ncbi:hypothetical protein JCGZ_11763 [Jatropha curcas]|uniref:Protein BREAKING OF ASYMMETRY IN THE STOMATAL LINEAGE n=1 Tax=Jatropha curcas TaxID=180498 RepID=A0A067K5I9_JATCU|nr:hypothetical protein JCGZ_11763 [Jatropha curcas]